MRKNSPDDDNSDTWPLLKINDYYTTRVCLIQIAVARHGELIFNIRAGIPTQAELSYSCLFLVLSVISKLFHVPRIECDSLHDFSVGLSIYAIISWREAGPTCSQFTFEYSFDVD